ncbi:TRAP transporter small permease [Chloroflexota bacterium]
MLVVNYEIALRFILNSPTQWVFPITTYALLFITFFIAPWLLREDKHIKMDVVIAGLNPRTRSVLNIITSILGVISCLLLTWYGGKATWQHLQIGFVFASPPFWLKWPFLAVIPVCSFLLFIGFLRRTYRFMQKQPTHYKKQNQIEELPSIDV